MRNELINLLGEERAALLSADFAQLEALAQKKERAVKRLQTEGLSPQELRRLSDLSEHNAKLLQATMKAIQDTTEFLVNGPTKPESWSYNATGKRETLQSAPQVLRQKA